MTPHLAVNHVFCIQFCFFLLSAFYSLVWHWPSLLDVFFVFVKTLKLDLNEACTYVVLTIIVVLDGED